MSGLSSRPWLKIGARVLVARPPQDCDWSGVWTVESLGGAKAHLRQNSSRISASFDRLELSPCGERGAQLLAVLRELTTNPAEQVAAIASLVVQAGLVVPVRTELEMGAGQ